MASDGRTRRRRVGERSGRFPLTSETSNLTDIPGGYLALQWRFFQRPEWTALQRLYGLAFRAERSMDSSLMYQAVAQGEVDVITAFSTDGRIAAQDIVLLEDDRGAIPPYDALVLVGPRVASEQPQVLAALASLAGTLDAAQMRRMNLAVDRDGRSPADVAQEFLRTLRAH